MKWSPIKIAIQKRNIETMVEEGEAPSSEGEEMEMEEDKVEEEEEVDKEEEEREEEEATGERGWPFGVRQGHACATKAPTTN